MTNSKRIMARALLMIVLFAMGFSGTAQAQEGEFDYSTQTLRVGVWLEGKENGDVLRKGEKFSVGFQTNQDSYAVIYQIDAGGQVSILWPRSRYDDGFAFGGHEYLLPIAGSRRLVASGDTGEGFVEAIVSQYPFDLRDLEVDFHHEHSDQPLNFQVAGDPFLAMNEVNYVVTGLEDSGDYVVTNYLSYYVHQEVAHPRYLCNQCHFEDDVAYHPYNDVCTLDIQYDYDWSNNWYDTYGYYPVYSNPVYVYVDPWTYQPWVNFWYNPWYTCAPGYGWGWGWNYSCWSWSYSPYYYGNCYTYYNDGHRRYGPLDRSNVAAGARSKTREYGRSSGLVAQKGPSDQERQALRTRTTLADRSSTGVRGKKPVRNPRTRIEPDRNERVNSGLRIRDNSPLRMGGENGRSPVRHTSGGSGSASSMHPVSRPSGGGGTVHTPVRGQNSTTARSRNQSQNINRGSGEKPASTRARSGTPTNPRARADKPSSGGRTIKPVEPRRKGTRVWNTRPQSGSTTRSNRNPSVKPGSRASQPKVTPRTNAGSSARNKNTNVSKPRSTPKVKSSGSKSGGSKSSGSRSSGSKSSGGGKSGGKSGGASRRR